MRIGLVAGGTFILGFLAGFMSSHGASKETLAAAAFVGFLCFSTFRFPFPLTQLIVIKRVVLPRQPPSIDDLKYELESLVGRELLADCFLLLLQMQNDPKQYADVAPSFHRMREHMLHQQAELRRRIAAAQPGAPYRTAA